MKRVLFAVAFLSFVAVVVGSIPAHADDEPMFPDGGSLVTPLDGGVQVTVDLGAHGSCWDMAIRCEGAQSTRYKLCAALPCTASAANQLIDSDRTFDIPVNCTGGNPAVSPKRFLALATDDGGVPSCKVQHSPF